MYNLCEGLREHNSLCFIIVIETCFLQLPFCSFVVWCISPRLICVSFPVSWLKGSWQPCIPSFLRLTVLLIEPFLMLSLDVVHQFLSLTSSYAFFFFSPFWSSLVFIVDLYLLMWLRYPSAKSDFPLLKASNIRKISFKLG